MSVRQTDLSLDAHSPAPPRAPLSRKISGRLLPALQLTRMALVFTALADSACGLFLRAKAQALRQTPAGAAPSAADVWNLVGCKPLVTIAIVSIGLYAFGMSLNDIVDRRRDRQVAPGRPLPSGRIGVAAAHLLCILMGSIALAAGIFYAHVTTTGWPCVLVLACTMMLIIFYDFAGKYLVGAGLLTLGLVRFSHAMIPAPRMPLVWQPLLLLNHITLLSTVAYRWEEKRPTLRKTHWWSVLSGLAAIDLLTVGGVGWMRYRRLAPGQLHDWSRLMQALWIERGLVWPAAAAGVFILLAIIIRRSTPRSHEAGQKLMLYGLLWLIIYDAAFALGYVGWIFAAALLALLPVGYVSVRFMRAWSKVLQAAPRSTYVRAETPR